MRNHVLFSLPYLGVSVLGGIVVLAAWLIPHELPAQSIGTTAMPWLQEQKAEQKDDEIIAGYCRRWFGGKEPHWIIVQDSKSCAVPPNPRPGEICGVITTQTLTCPTQDAR